MLANTCTDQASSPAGPAPLRALILPRMLLMPLAAAFFKTRQLLLPAAATRFESDGLQDAGDPPLREIVCGEVASAWWPVYNIASAFSLRFSKEMLAYLEITCSAKTFRADGMAVAILPVSAAFASARLRGSGGGLGGGGTSSFISSSGLPLSKNVRRVSAVSTSWNATVPSYWVRLSLRHSLMAARSSPTPLRPIGGARASTRYGRSSDAM